MRNSIRLSILAAATAAMVSPALAAPTLNFSIQANQFNKPTMEFEFQGGKYVWKQQTINTEFSASANTNDNDLIWEGNLKIQTNSVSGSASFDGSVPTQVKSWSLSGPIVFPVSFLSVYKNGFADYCENNGVIGSTHVNQNLSILFTAMQSYGKKPQGGGAPPEVQHGDGPSYGTFAQKVVNMPMTVSCGAKPSSGIARPGGLKQETPDFKVKSIALNYGGVPGMTKPNAATQCKQAKLTVTLHTSKAGVVDFRLHKKIGGGPTQAKNVQVYAKFDGNAHFVASHQETVSVSKTTLVQAMAEEFVNPIGLTTGWKDVTLRCEDIGGGFASNPSNANPDGLPAKPKQPKRVFDGPGNLNPGKPKPTHSTVKPVILPAQIKTAPVQTKTAPKVQSQQRTPKQVGRLSFGVEREMKESGRN